MKECCITALSDMPWYNTSVLKKQIQEIYAAMRRNGEQHEKSRRLCTQYSGFPGKGIIFRDITSVIQDPEGLKLAIDGIQNLLKDVDFDVVVGPESRGFIFGVPIAYNNHTGFVPVRKKGKLPCETISEEYALEYGTATIEIHKDAIQPGQKVVIVDDLIATGGTTEAAIHMIERLGGEVVKVVFLMELEGLKGRERLKDYDVDAVIKYPGK